MDKSCQSRSAVQDFREEMNHLQFQSKLGRMVVEWNDQGKLTQIRWGGDEDLQGKAKSEEGQWFALCNGRIPTCLITLLDWLNRYAETGTPMVEIPWEEIDQSNWSEFQRKVYEATAAIPHGETRTYAWVASRIGKVNATRAVGQALRKNPVPILIPCHRVVAANALGGFMGASCPNARELRLKRRLLEVEESYRSPVFSFLSQTFTDPICVGVAG